MTQTSASPDLILVTGIFRTQDPANPQANALALGAGRIPAVGGNESIAALAVPETEYLDLGGKLGLPGFIDIHFHFFDRALGRLNLSLAGLPSLVDLLETVKNETVKNRRF
jgi:predicted amidohydrolase YtcJ